MPGVPPAGRAAAGPSRGDLPDASPPPPGGAGSPAAWRSRSPAPWARSGASRSRLRSTPRRSRASAGARMKTCPGCSRDALLRRGRSAAFEPRPQLEMGWGVWRDHVEGLQVGWTELRAIRELLNEQVDVRWGAGLPFEGQGTVFLEIEIADGELRRHQPGETHEKLRNRQRLLAQTVRRRLDLLHARHGGNALDFRRLELRRCAVEVRPGE